MDELSNAWFMGVADNPDPVKDMILKDNALHALNSAKKNANLKPYLMYDGKDKDFLKLAKELDAVVVEIKSRLERYWQSKSDGWKATARGAFLRMEVPQICEMMGLDEEYILYTDCDILFLKNPALQQFKPKYFAASTERYNDRPYEQKYDDLNSGVLWMNVEGMEGMFDEFKEKCIEMDFSTQNFDQDIIKSLYAGRWDYLPETYNWKTYWGISSDAYIVHFHGPKVHLLELMLEWEQASDPLSLDAFSIKGDGLHSIRVYYNDLKKYTPDFFILYNEFFPVCGNEETIKYYIKLYQKFNP